MDLALCLEIFLEATIAYIDLFLDKIEAIDPIEAKIAFSAIAVGINTSVSCRPKHLCNLSYVTMHSFRIEQTRGTHSVITHNLNSSSRAIKN